MKTNSFLNQVFFIIKAILLNFMKADTIFTQDVWFYKLNTKFFLCPNLNKVSIASFYMGLKPHLQLGKTELWFHFSSI